MNIQLNDNFRIKSTSTEFTLETVKETGEKSKTPGEKIWVTAGHYGTLKAVLSSVPDQVVKNSEATNLKELVTEIERYRRILVGDLK